MKNPGYKDQDGEWAAQEARIVWWRSKALVTFDHLEKAEFDRDFWKKAYLNAEKRLREVEVTI